MAKLTIVANVDLNDSSRASDLLASVSQALEDMLDACDAGHAQNLANTSGVIVDDPDDEFEEPFGTWKWE